MSRRYGRDPQRPTSGLPNSARTLEDDVRGGLANRRNARARWWRTVR